MDSHRVHLLRFLGGAIAAFYGRHFTHILLYASLVLHTDGRYALLYDRLLKQVHELGTLSRDAWRALNEAQLRAAGTAALEHAGRVSTLREQLARARACGNHHEAEVLELEVADAEQAAILMGAASSSMIARACSSISVAHLGDVLKEFLLSASELASAAAASGMARIGVRINLADEIMHAIDDSFGMLLWRVLQRLRDYVDHVDRLLSDAHSRRWTERLLSALCQSVGVGLAFYIEGLFFTVTNAVWGAEMMAASVNGVVTPRVLTVLPGQPLFRHRLKWAVAIGGVTFQVIGRGRQLPQLLRAAFWLPLVVEGWLRTATLAARGPLRFG